MTSAIHKRKTEGLNSQNNANKVTLRVTNQNCEFKFTRTLLWYLVKMSELIKLGRYNSITLTIMALFLLAPWHKSIHVKIREKYMLK